MTAGCCDEGHRRSYETRLDERMKKKLREARQEMDNGRRAMLAKRKWATGSANGLDHEQNIRPRRFRPFRPAAEGIGERAAPPGSRRSS
jgi:hypothetical protein